MARRTASGRLPGGGEADSGYALAALLVGLAVMGLAMSMALPVWSQAARRERELELIFRGEQYARAIELYQRIYAGAYPPDIDTLIEQRFLRRRYRDPMVPDGEFRIVYQAEVSELLGGPAAVDGAGAAGGAERAAGDLERVTGGGAAPRTPGFGADAMTTPAGGDSRLAEGLRGGVAGVVSRSADESIRIYDGRTTYNEWVFVHGGAEARPGGPAEDGFGGTPQPGRLAETPGRVDATQPFGPGRPRRAGRPQ